MKKEFYSNGKLLVTGEYVVLDGALAFAIPTKFGQTMKVAPTAGNVIHWKSYDADGSLWFDAVISFESIIEGKNQSVVDTIKSKLIEILHECYLINSNFITESEGYTIENYLSFNKNWGLGTSSTLINNIAQWLEIDAFYLQQKTFGGSGYDIACAQSDLPVLYQLENDTPKFSLLDFNPDFKEHLYFVYLNQKQNSRDAIQSYWNKRAAIEATVLEIDRITQKIVTTDTVTTFSDLLQKHEILLSDILEVQTVQERLFPDFNGTIKSLGAWGGDFVLAVSNENPTAYFEKKGFKTILPYTEMVL